MDEQLQNEIDRIKRRFAKEKIRAYTNIKIPKKFLEENGLKIKKIKSLNVWEITKK